MFFEYLHSKAHQLDWQLLNKYEMPIDFIAANGREDLFSNHFYRQIFFFDNNRPTVKTK